MKKNVIFAIAFLALAPILIRAGSGPAYPLKLSAGNHYLVDQAGTPFFIQGEAAWSLIAQLDTADVETYLSDRWAKGFNTIIVNLIEHYYADNAPANYYGVYPFTNKLSGGYWDFSSINPDYFTNSDAAISRAGYYGIQVILAPAYLGYGGGSEGWYQDMTHNSLVNLTNWGNYVGNRYKSYTNIIWLNGCDYEAPNKTVVDAVASGILQQDPSHLMTAHCKRGDSAFDYYTESWDNFNSTYTASIAYIKTLSDYQRSPVAPTFLVEAYYEVPGNPSYPAIQTRWEAYGAVLSGAMGGCFGVDKIDVFSSGWQANLQSPGSLAYTNLIKLVRTRPWYNCVPDSGHTVVTSGYGTSGQTDYITAMRESTGKTIIAYVPQDQMTFTVAMNQISGSTANAWWYNPQTGAATLIGSYGTSGSKTFTPPDNYDWVLVLDDASQNYGAPGAAPGLPTSCSLTSSVNPALPGQAVVFTCTLSPVAPETTTPTGTIQFTVDGANAGGPITLSGGTAAYTSASLAHGAHSVVAEYSGDALFFATNNALSPVQVIDTPPVAGPATMQREPASGAKIWISAVLTNCTDADGDPIVLAGVSATSANGGTVVTNNGWIFYTPASGFVNSDSFTYTISDGYVSVTGTVTVNIQVDNGPSANLSVSVQSDGSYAILGDGIPGYTYHIQFADNPEGSNWQALGTVTADSSGMFQFIDSAGTPQRSYRSVYP